jgi:predicted ATPase/DNA-binding SARP family transcriptional activator
MNASYPQSQRAEQPYRLHLFGAFALLCEGKVIHLPTQKTQQLLAYLVLNSTPQPREHLAALLWGDSSMEQASGSLRKALTLLRKALGQESLLADRETIQINPSFTLWVDALDFQEQARQFLATSSSNPDGIELDLYQDDLLANLYEDWIIPWRDKLRDLYHHSLFHLIHLHQSRGIYDRAIACAARILARDPANEDAHYQLMLSYFSSGNYTAALKQFEVFRRVLLKEIGVEPSPQTKALYQRIQRERDRDSHPRSLINLPVPLTSFIGREEETSQIRRLLAASRLVTLTGAGGCGKTRLAIQVAQGLQEEFADGIWWLELAALTDGEIVPEVLAKTLGFIGTPSHPVLDLLASKLGTRKILLVWDNCEHLIRSCAFMAEDLLSRCPNLKILATSREALNIAGETTWMVPSLRTPSQQLSQPPSALLAFDSVKLFVERAQSIRPAFAITQQNAPAIAEICRELEGIPLALELAAARVKTLSVEQITARLNDRFSLLNAGSRMALPRHQTLRAVIDWSYDLLEPAEKCLLCWLSVFTGGFTLDAVENMLSQVEGSQNSGKALSRLEQLINKSLVVVEEGLHENQNRYSCLETVRQYALEKLRAAEVPDYRSSLEGVGDALERARDAHLAYFSGLLDQASDAQEGTEWSRWVKRFELEMANFRAMQDWALETDPIRALEIGGTDAFMRFWGRSGYGAEGCRWLQEALVRVRSLPVNEEHYPQLRSSGVAAGDIVAEFQKRRRRAEAYGLTSLGLISTGLGDYRKSFLSLQEGLALWRVIGDLPGQALCLSMMGTQAMLIENFQESLQYAEECLSIARAIGDDLSAAIALTNFGFYHIRREGNLEKGLACLEESIQLIMRHGSQWQAGIPVLYIGRFMAEQGNYSRGRALLEEAQRIFSLNVDRLFLNVTRSGLADIAFIECDFRRAEDLYIETALEWERIGNIGAMALCLERLAFIAVERAKSQAGDERHDGLHRAGLLLGAAEQLRKTNHAPMMPHEQEDYAVRIADARALSIDDNFSAAWEEGRSISQDEVAPLLKC